MSNLNSGKFGSLQEERLRREREMREEEEANLKQAAAESLDSPALSARGRSTAPSSAVCAHALGMPIERGTTPVISEIVAPATIGPLASAPSNIKRSDVPTVATASTTPAGEIVNGVAASGDRLLAGYDVRHRASAGVVTTSFPSLPALPRLTENKLGRASTSDTMFENL
jgi:hypothetical protein